MGKSADPNEREGKSYEDRSRRITAWSEFLRSFSKVLWVLVILIVLGVLGKTWLFKKSGAGDRGQEITKKPVVTRVEWSKINRRVEEVMRKTRLQIEKKAEKKLNVWIEDQMKRVDNDFLPWYFSYWTQQTIGLKSLMYQVLNWVDSDNPPPAERITQEVQEELVLSDGEHPLADARAQQHCLQLPASTKLWTSSLPFATSSSVSCCDVDSEMMRMTGSVPLARINIQESGNSSLKPSSAFT